METLAPKKPLVIVITSILLLVSFILILADVEACLNIAYTLMALGSSAKADAAVVGTVLTFLLGIAALAYTIFALEYHVKHAGEPRSRKLLGISLGTQIVLAVIGLLIL